MIVACRAIGMAVDEGAHGKMFCPWGEFTHPDGGDEPAFRVYSDHGFCFACWQYYTPVSLCTAAWEVAEDSVAEKLLHLAGVAPESYDELWDRVVRPIPIDTRAIWEALRTYCVRNFPRWESLQYHDEVSLYLARCRGLLTRVENEADARQWLDACSLVLDEVLRRVDAQA